MLKREFILVALVGFLSGFLGVFVGRYGVQKLAFAEQRQKLEDRSQKTDTTGRLKLQPAESKGSQLPTGAKGEELTSTPKTLTPDKGKGKSPGHILLDPGAGNVGIGTATPGYKLDVSGSERTTGDLYVDGNDIYTRGVSTNRWASVNASGCGIDALNSGDWDFLVYEGDCYLQYSNPSGHTHFGGDLLDYNDAWLNVGENLDVNGSVKISGGIHDGASYGSDGQVLKTNGVGDISWAADNDGGTDGDWTISGTNQYSAVSGNVGIGTTTPTWKLYTVGTGYFSSTLRADGAIQVDGNIVIDNGAGWHRSYGNTGWYNGTYGGGWYMTDGTWIRSYGNKSILHNTGTMRTDGTFRVGSGGATLNVPNGGNFAYRTNVLFANTAGNVGVRNSSPGDYLVDVKIASVWGDGTYRGTIGWYLGSEPTVTPSVADYGYVGVPSASGPFWYKMYSNYYYDVSCRELKRDINEVDDATYELAMVDIDKIKPSFYKMKVETDEMEPGNETKYHPNMRLGIMVEDAPDYIQDNSFSAIDLYALTTLALVGVKYLRSEIQELRKELGLPEKRIDINEIVSSIPPEFMEQLDVPEWKKEKMKQWWASHPVTKRATK